MATQEEKIVVKAEVQELTKLRNNLKEASNEFLKLKGSLPASELKVLENNVRQASVQLKAANEDIRRLTGTAKNHTMQNLQMAASYVGLGIGIQQAIQFSKEAINAYAQEETSLRTLEFSITKVVGGNEQLVKSLEDYASATQTRVSIDDEVIRQQEAFLVLQGRTEEQIKQIINAAIDLSAVQGDLSNENVIENVKKLDGTYEGVVGKLGKYDERLKTLTQTQLQNGDAVKILGEKYKGTADEINKGVEGNLRTLKVWGHEALEIIGGFIVMFGGIPQLFLLLRDRVKEVDSAWEIFQDNIRQTISDIPLLGGLSDILHQIAKDANNAADAIRGMLGAGTQREGIAKEPTAHGATETRSTTGGKTRTEREVDAIQELVKQVQNQIELERLLNKLNTDFLIAKKNLLTAEDNENLKIEQRIALLKEVEAITQNIKNIFGSAFSFQAKTFDLSGGEIKQRTIAQDDPMRHLFDERIQKEIELYKGEIAAAEKTLSIFQDSVNLLEQFFGIQLPKEFDLLMNMLSQFIQGLGGGGSGLFGLLGNLAMSFIPGGQLIQGLAGGATPQGMINRPVGITGGRPVINQIIIKNPITLREALEVHESYMNKKNG